MMDASSMILGVVVLLFSISSCNGQSYPFQNLSLSFTDRVKNLVDMLSLDELVIQMARGGADQNGPAPGIPRLGIRPYQWGTECLTGDVEAGPATSFPMALGMAASFDYDLVYKVAVATSEEVRAKNTAATVNKNYNFHTGLSCWSPVINIMRDPRWGRNQETFGEDPWLSGYLAKAAVTGLQGNDSRYLRTNAGCKHFAAYAGPENIPLSRYSFNAVVNERDLRMTFLPQFKMCVEAGSWSIMCSYNSVNGIPACASPMLLTDILRKEWNFPGYVVSDQGALESIAFDHKYTKDLLNASVVAAQAGTCLEDANGHNTTQNAFDSLGNAVVEGMVSIDVLKDAVSRLLMVRMRLGEFDPPSMNPYTKITTDVIQSPAHQNLTLTAALETFVLLKYSPSSGLPIQKSKICIVGPFIDNLDLLFGDYSPDVMAQYTVTPLAGLKKHLSGSTITSSVGCTDSPYCNKYNHTGVVSTCTGVDIVIITAGLGRHLEGEGNDRSGITLPSGQFQMMLDAANAAPNAKVHLIMFNAGPVDISWAVQNSQVTVILAVFYPAQATGDALGMVYTGKYSPAGRLPYTWPVSVEEVPPITNYSMAGRTYRYFTKQPLFPFGYGLSFTQFNYSNLTLNATSIKAGQDVSLTVTVANVGTSDGDEVTQVYIEWDNKVSEAPLRQLVGAQRTHLTQKQSLTLNFVILSSQMEVWSTKWEVPVCSMTVYVGGQQPNQSVQTNSNVLSGQFSIS